MFDSDVTRLLSNDVPLLSARHRYLGRRAMVFTLSAFEKVSSTLGTPGSSTPTHVLAEGGLAAVAAFDSPPLPPPPSFLVDHRPRRHRRHQRGRSH